MSEENTTSVQSTESNNDSFENNEGQEGQQQENKQESKEQPPKKKAPSFRKYKIGNEEVNLSDEDIARDYAKWKSSDQKFREAAEARKSVETFMKKLQEDPEAILNDPRLSIDKRKLAEKWLLSQIEEELHPQDPRDKKLTEAERRLKEYEEKEQQRQEEQQKNEYEKVKEHRKQQISQTLRTAMEATHLSQDPESAASVLREMAMYMRLAKERGEDVTTEQLVEHIHNQRFTQFYSLAHQMQGDELIEFLGPEIVKRIRQSDLARLKSKREQTQQHKDESWVPQKQEKVKKMSGLDARDHAHAVLFGKK